MKVLYIGNYCDASGWGDTAEANILAMHSAGIKVAARPISFGRQKEVHPIIRELEKVECKGADFCVQHVLPKYYYYNSKIFNIGFHCYETSSLVSSGWNKYLSMMDANWAMSWENIQTMQECGIFNGSQVSFSIDPDKYDINLKTGEIEELKQNEFNFCFVGDWNKRKNIIALLRAYYSEFHPSEPVGLFIKLSSNLPSDQCTKEFHKLNDFVKSGLKLRKNYQNISVICGDMEKPDYISVINQCHCFVCPSHGEACCIPAVEAQALGLQVISTNNIGLISYLGDGCSAISSYKDDCFGMESSLPEIQTAREQWYNINIGELRYAMRGHYLNHKSLNKEENSKQYKALFNHKNVGQTIKGILDGYC